MAISDNARALRETFVSGLTGTTHAEAAALAVVYPAAMWCFEWLRERRAVSGKWASAALEFVVTFSPLVAAYTVLSHVALWIAAGLALLPALWHFFWESSVERRARLLAADELSAVRAQPAFLSAWRSSLLLTTCVCILAVDFRAFPRRFGKTETYGVSPMDGGVGGFVLSAGLVAPHARAVLGARSARGGWRAFVRRAKRVALTTALGVARLLSTRAVNYQHHTSEYGAHWNFFFTLAAIQALSLAVPVGACVGARCTPLYAGLALAFAYQALLSYGGLSAAVLSEDRGPSFVAQNREGLSSTIGLLALYWVGAGVGQRIYRPRARAERAARRAERELLGAFFASALVAWGAGEHVERPSRRLANLAYCAWVLAVALLIMLALRFVEVQRGARAPPRLAAAASTWSLPLFLFANVLTGACNLCVDTLAVGRGAAFAILVAYAAVLALALVALDACASARRGRQTFVVHAYQGGGKVYSF